MTLARLDEIEARSKGQPRVSELYADNAALLAIVRAVQQIAFDPDTVSAIEHGAISFGPNLYEGVSAHDALGYAKDALRDIRRALGGDSEPCCADCGRTDGGCDRTQEPTP